MTQHHDLTTDVSREHFDGLKPEHSYSFPMTFIFQLFLAL